MRSRTALLAIIIVASAFAVPYLAHASIPFFGPIVPHDQATCPGAWGLLMVVINNVISFLLTLIIVFVAPLSIAYAGFLYVWNSQNPSGIEEAKSILKNTIIGIIVALAAWMIVDLVMAVLYNPSAFSTTWTDLLSTRGDTCLKQLGAYRGDIPNDATNLTGIDAMGNFVSKKGVNLSQCPTSNTACGVPALQADGFTVSQANVMSCIAMTESSGNPGRPCNGNACGLFQVMLSLNPLDGAACSAYPVHDCTGKDACYAVGTSARNLNSDACKKCIQEEIKAAWDPRCNAQTALGLVRKHGYSDWTCANCNAKAQGCVDKYSSVQ